MANTFKVVASYRKLNFKKFHSNIEVTFNYLENDKISFTINDEAIEFSPSEAKVSNSTGDMTVSNNFFVFEDLEDIQKWNTWIKNNRKNQVIIEKESPFVSAFKASLVLPDDYIYKKLVQHIHNCAEDWVGLNQYYAPFVIFCQSSGYGKSKFLYEYANDNITLFMCLRDEYESGYPLRSKISDSFLTVLCNDDDTIKAYLIALIEAALELIQIIKNRPDIKSVNDIANELKKYQPWLNDGDVYEINKQTLHFFERVNAIKELKSCVAIDQLKERFDNIMKLGENKLCLSIAIDEAHALISKKEITLFQRLRSSVNKHFQGFKIVFIMTSTNTSISNFMLKEGQLTHSQLLLNKGNYSPFCNFTFCDYLKSAEYENQLTLIYNKNCNGIYEFISKLDPFTTLFFYGRAFWASIFKANKESDQYNINIVTIARSKLILAKDWKNEKLNKSCASIAILAVRTNLLNNFVIINQHVSENLIRSYLATLFDIDEKCNILSLRYVSEPILSEAAAYYMSQDTIMNDILDCLFTMISTAEIVETGKIGELVAEIILLLAKDKAASKHLLEFEAKGMYSRPITVQQFLIALVGIKKFDKIFKNNVSEKILNGLLTFSHFIQKIDTLKKRELFHDFIGRSAAGRFRDLFPVYDLFIPIIFKNDELGCILIQVKNHAVFFPNSVNEKMIPENVFKSDWPPNLKRHSTDIDIKNDSALSILMSLGDEKNEIKKNLNVFSFQGLGVYKCLNNSIANKLKLLLNFSRNSMANYSDKKVCELVTHGCAAPDYFKY